MAKRVLNAAKAAVAIAKNPGMVSEQVEGERGAVCDACEFYAPGAIGTCTLCGCSRLKLKFAAMACPIGKWKAVTP